MNDEGELAVGMPPNGADDPLVARVLEAQAEERERIARELHDETGQSLTALLVGLRSLEAMVDGDARQRVVELRGHVRDLIERVGRLARGLHPPALGELALAAVIEQQATDFERDSGIATSVIVDTPERLEQLTREATLAVYRVVQEGLTNVWRHAGAKHVEVQVHDVDGHICVEVSDDGNGLAHRKPEGRGLGIRLLRRRVESLGGGLTVDAVVGKGTTLRVVIPLPSVTP